MTPFALAALCGWAALVLLAWQLRSRAFAAFTAVLLGVHSLVLVQLEPMTGRAWPAVWALHGLVLVQLASLVRARMRPGWWRAAVSVPAAWFMAGTLLALPWAVAAGVGGAAAGFFAPWVVAAFGTFQSLRGRAERVDVVLGGAEIQGARPRRVRSPRPRGDGTPLRIVQITDTHLGPFMPVERLAAICEAAVAAEPDLILLTGDFLTMESAGTPGALAEALRPLAALPGRVFACEGNHDLEAPRVVEAGLAGCGARLLRDAAETVESPIGPVQIVGLAFRWRLEPAEAAELLAAHPRPAGALRIVLNHHPATFAALPDGEADLVLSGHTHGGQLGLVSLGLPWTVVSVVGRIPDHGLWGRGRNRLYVHRGTGQYGFPLRVGVPSEQSVLRVYRG